MYSDDSLEIVTLDMDIESDEVAIREGEIFPLYHNKPSMDQSSVEGKFFWLVSNQTCIPQILRFEPDGSQRGYVSVLMSEKTILGPFLKTLPYEVITNPTIFSHKVTSNERRLLYEINNGHCNSSFGRTELFMNDLLVRSEDFCQYFTYLSLCQARISPQKLDGEKRFGFLRINKTNDVPYVVVGGQKMIPCFYFEEAGDGSLREVDISGWDWTYLKFCCKVQGVKQAMLTGSSCPCVSEGDLKSLLPVGTTFQEYWPERDFINKMSSSRTSKVGGWTRLVLSLGARFEGELVPIKEFPVQSNQSNSEAPYRAELASIENKKVNCLNIQPYAWQDVVLSLPHLVEQLFPGFSDQQVGQLLLREGASLYRNG